MNLMGDFWTLKKDGSLIHQDSRILCIDEAVDKRFEVVLGESNLSATIEEQEDGWYMETNKGWGMKIPSENYLSVMIGMTGGSIWIGDAQLIIYDLDAMGLL